MKKGIISMVLASAIVLINAIPTYAGTERQFWEMDIRSSGLSSELTSRNTENYNQYSWVKVDSMSQGIQKVTTSFMSGFYAATHGTTITYGVNTGTWVKQSYITNVPTGAPMKLVARNYYITSATGSIGGWVDYE